jgi:FkbM family methyltransferase
MFKTARYTLAGIYFTYFKKVFIQNGIKIHVPLELTDYKFRGRFVLGTYEKEEATYLAQFLDPGDCVLELGACLGYVSCLVNTILDDKQKHVVMEANPKLINYIERNKKENNCGFHIENAIISDLATNAFYIHDLIVGSSQKRKTPHKIEVNGVRISQLESDYDLSFNVLIMDIEGGELELLRNHQDEISGFERIFMELHPFAGILTLKEAEECEIILRSLGFSRLLQDGNYQIWQNQDHKNIA